MSSENAPSASFTNEGTKLINDAATVLAVGSLGGSGTRVIADILSALGVFMGAKLNDSSDNLLFTLLFKNPVWFHTATQDQIQYRLYLFEKITTGVKLNLTEMRDLLQISIRAEHVSMRTSVSILLANLDRTPERTVDSWGWKEPNTQLFIEHISTYFNRFKYIQVIRHGLDMAFSSNRQQLRNWNHLFNLDERDKSKNSNALQLDYWIKSNQYAIENGKRLLGTNFYLLNYDRLCQDPRQEIAALCAFLAIDPNTARQQMLIDMVHISPSTNRYKQRDLSVFSNEQLAQVQKLGFAI